VNELLERPRRRGVLGILATGGIGLIGGLASMVATADPAEAFCQPEACCNLASCRTCAGSCHFTCPSGWHRQQWFCLAGTRIIGCGECTRSTTTCESGPWYCSVMWDDGVCG